MRLASAPKSGSKRAISFFVSSLSSLARAKVSEPYQAQVSG
jgi:hypothetical protein